MPVISDGRGVTAVSVTATTDAATFYVTHTFDLGAPTLAYARMTVLALVPDGETFGNAAGQIGCDWTFAGTALPVPVGVSRDNASYFDALGAPTMRANIGVAVADYLDSVLGSPRYLKLGAFIYVNDTGNIYAGANHPTAQVRFDLVYQ